MVVRITCVDKPSGNIKNPHEAISNYGWINEQNGKKGIASRREMVDWIKNENGRAYVKDAYGNIVYCYVRTSVNGTEFLQTYTDNKYTDNLLSLPSCSY